MSSILSLIKSQPIEKAYRSRFTFTEKDLDLLDVELGKADESMLDVAASVVLSEKVDKSRLDMKNKANEGYIFMWTNRVCLYVFFKTFSSALKELGLEENPFEAYAHAEGALFNAWKPALYNRASRYAKINKGLPIEDALQECFLGYRNAQLKRAMFLIGSSYKSQCAGFDKSLEYAVKKEIQNFIASSTLACRIPIEDVEARRNAKK